MKNNIVILFVLIFSGTLHAQSILGDMNEDNCVDVADVNEACNIVLQISPVQYIPSSHIFKGDMNGDGLIDITDINAMCNCIIENKRHYVNVYNYAFETGYFQYRSGSSEWSPNAIYKCLSVDLGENTTDIDSVCLHIGGCNSWVGTVAFADKDFNVLYKDTNYNLVERTIVYDNLPEGTRWLFCNSNPNAYDTPSCVIVRNSLTPESKYPNLEGKKILMLGDSQTEFRDGRTGKGITEYSGAIIDSYYGTTLQSAQVIRGGIGGGHLSCRKEKPNSITSTGDGYAVLDVPNVIDALIEQDWNLVQDAVNYLKDNAGDDNTPILENLKSVNMNEIDYITIFAGTNDWNSNVKLGQRGDTINVNNYYGAINYITTRLRENYPHIKIAYFTPVVRWMTVGDPATWSDVNKNKANLTLLEVSDGMIDACQYSNVPCFDLYRNLGWNMENFSLYFQDTTHCSKGYHIVAQYMMQFLNKL